MNNRRIELVTACEGHAGLKLDEFYPCCRAASLMRWVGHTRTFLGPNVARDMKEAIRTIEEAGHETTPEFVALLVARLLSQRLPEEFKL